MSVATVGVKRKKHSARLVGAAAAGASELILFYPVDTIAKRLMSNRMAPDKSQRLTGAMSTLNKVGFLLKSNRS